MKEEVAAEVDLVREEAEVEVAMEVVTADANKEDRRKSMVIRVALFMWEQNTRGKIARRIRKVRTSREVICNSNRAEAEVDSLLQEADLAVAVDTVAVEEIIINNRRTII